ncbi:MAG TPA: carbohydrate ABC transporter permease [Candidatus Caccousia avistercoris]|nr:carbohydrate ABC transporter permease [Candidatus Caccousia avistercoris]
MTVVKHIFGVLLKLILIFIFGFPFFWMLSTSLQTLEEVNTVTPTFLPAVPQFQNYVDAWNAGSSGMGVYLKNSVIVVVAIIAIQLVIMVPAAYAFARYKFRFKGFCFGLVLIALMMPTQITFLPIYLMFSDLDLINTLWPQILPFMTDAFSIFLLRQYFMQVPDELVEAAKLDNASEAKIIFRLMLPMAKPALATIILFSFLGHWNDYFWPLVMTNSDAVRTLPVGVAQLKQMEGLANWNVIMAGNGIMVFPILLVYIFASKKIIHSFAYSGIK